MWGIRTHTNPQRGEKNSDVFLVLLATHFFIFFFIYSKTFSAFTVKCFGVLTFRNRSVSDFCFLDIEAIFKPYCVRVEKEKKKFQDGVRKYFSF